MGTEQSWQLLEGALGEDHKSAEVTTWSKLDDVESSNVASVDTWEVSGSSLDISGGVAIDDEWSLSHDVLGVSVLSLSASQRSGVSDLGEVVTETEVSEGAQERLGVGGVQGVNDEWELWNVLDVVTSGHYKRSNGRGSQSGGDGMSSLGEIDSSVPLSPDLEWSEHSGLSAHVTEGGLARSGSTGSRDSWDSCDGSTSSPGLSRVLLTSLEENSMTLSSVLGKFGVHEVNEIVSDGCREDAWHWDASSEFLSIVTLVDGHNRS